MPLGTVRDVMLAVKRGIQGILVGPTQITTSTASTATAYSNQRKIDRTSNGVLWALVHDGANGYLLTARYSTDNGATWTSAGVVHSSSGSYISNSSLFIDQDDYAHVVYKNATDGYIYYRRGTPNAGRTAWTWSAATAVRTDTYQDFPDVVAHREGTGWVAHVVESRVLGTSNYTSWTPLTISSDGVVTMGTRVVIGGSYGTSAHTYPSIDFNHTGDGKTVAGGTPHLYVAWSAGATGAGKGIRFKKATYSGGTWTWGTEREIDSTRYIPNDSFWLNCLFDGMRVVVPGDLYSGSVNDLMLYERNVSDTSTTTRTLAGALAAGSLIHHGSSTYDNAGNLYVFGRDASTSPQDLVYTKWTRSTNTLSARTTIDADVDVPYVSVKRGYSNDRIEFIYTDGTTSPYSVKYGAIK